jgi:4-hydroxy-3-methylbut-2-enyl diphosphate reductase
VALAVEAAYEIAGGRAFMYGEVVHNPGVVADLRAKGLEVARDIAAVPDEPGAKALIRAHGVSKEELRALRARGMEIVDRTCPKVKAMRGIVADASMRGLNLLVVGTPDHPEIAGVMGWGAAEAIFLRDMDDARRLVPGAAFSDKGVCMVAQTTYNEKKYLEIYDYCAGVVSNIEFHRTVCHEAASRQNEVRELAGIVDSVIIVGGGNSSNVERLREIAAEGCARVQKIESASEIGARQLAGVEALLLASGTSTPTQSVEEAVAAVRAYCAGEGIAFELERL